jgi:hypothetical protein
MNYTENILRISVIKMGFLSRLQRNGPNSKTREWRTLLVRKRYVCRAACLPVRNGTGAVQPLAWASRPVGNAR